ncbi:hypothetical protein ACMAY8_05875 [Rhodobacteraceae bacterium nBUS_22]
MQKKDLATVLAAQRLKTDAYGFSGMNYGGESIRIHKKLRLEKAVGSDN